MAVEKQTIVMGVFRDHTLTKQAMDELRDTQWIGDATQVRLVGERSSGVIDRIRNTLAEPKSSQDQVAEELSGLDLPEDQRQRYLREIENGAYYAGSDDDTDEVRSLRLREERLQADKEVVQSGEVNLRKDVVTEQQSLDVPVQHEEVYIERHDLGGRVSDTPVGQNESIRVPVREEQVNVTKTPVETGEVRIGKRTRQDTQRVTDTVQREEAHVERSGETPLHDNTMDEHINNR